MVATVTAAAVNFANSTAAPFVFPQISSAATAEGALPPGTLDFRRANQIDMKDPRTTQWSLTFERDLGWNTGARVSYVGSKTNDLVWSPDLNQVRANTLGYAAVSQTRPFPDWNVVTTRDNGPKSRYDGLGLELNKRFSNSLALNASYTLARHLSDAGGTVPTAFAAENGATTVDLFRGDADYGNVAFTRRHRFISTFLYELPIGRSRRWLSDIGPALDALVGGWDATGVLLLQSGPFLTPSFSTGDPSGTGTTVRGFTATQRPDAVGDGNISNPTADAYFDAHRLRTSRGQHRALRQRRGRHARRPGDENVFDDARQEHHGEKFVAYPAGIRILQPLQYREPRCSVADGNYVERVRPHHRYTNRRSGRTPHDSDVPAISVLRLRTPGCCIPSNRRIGDDCS